MNNKCKRDFDHLLFSEAKKRKYITIFVNEIWKKCTNLKCTQMFYVQPS